MPTMTKQTLNRRLNRHSLDNQLDDISTNRTRHSRYSLTSIANKENFGVHFTHSPFGNTSFIALHDLSNGKSPIRPEAPTSLRRRTLEGLTLSSTQVTPLSSFNGTPDRNAQTKSMLQIEQKKSLKSQPSRDIRFQEETLSSSRMGDVTLDEVLEAIIESARKDVKDALHDFQVPRIPEARSVTPLYGTEDFEETSFHEMEVCTPPHLKRQRVVRRKNTKTAEKKKSKSEKRLNVPSENLNFIPYTHAECSTPVLLGIKKRENMINLCVKNLDAQIQNFKLTPSELEATEEVPSIKRCLSFSSDDDVDYSAAKRSSVASSNASSMNGDFLQFNSGRWSRNSRESMRGDPKGCIELAAFFCEKVLNVHVIRCRDLLRPNGSSVINAYVKVVVINKDTPDVNNIVDNGFQRTAVHRHSSRPHFDHWFKFDLTKSFEETKKFDADDRLQLAVWHRDRQLKRSEFLGCLSFSLHTLLQQSVNGVFKLQSQACLNNPQLAVPIPSTTTIVTNTAQHLQNLTNRTAAPPASSQQFKLNKVNEMTTVTSQQYKSDEDVVNIDIMAQNIGNEAPSDASGGEPPMILSKKALHQRDADENLFLRFLELDPPTTEPAVVSSSASTTGNNNSRRLSNTNTNTTNTPQTTNKLIGRTPFTMTKRLTRTADRGFGFSIVWTHPPRVEKVEPGLSADRKGILPGDYVIFVDKHNVVTMPEADVLNLIRSQGSSLTLEIFRRQAGVGDTSMLPQALSLSARSNATTFGMNGKATGITTNDEVFTITTTTTTTNAPSIKSRQIVVSNNIHNNNVNVNITNGSNVNIRPSTVCSVGTTSSVEAAKRRLNLPQVTFSKESIVPITDNRRRFLLQLISREQNFISALHFGMQRFVQPLQERKDLMTPNDHRTLFQNIDELLRISEDILEQLSNDGQEPQMNFASRVYLSKTTAICAAYKKYCTGIKRADCILVNKTRQAGSEFLVFINEPPVPRKRPDLTMFIHRPLQHFREILKLMQMLASNSLVDTEEHKNFMSVINELQAAYREITVSSGLMEPLCEGRPLLTLQDLESRMVFTKCKPFTLAVQGRQWIFGGDLSRVEGRSIKPYWTLLFSDIIVFAKVSRDRVLFITEEPVPIANIVDSCFNMRKKTTEFRLTVDPNGRLAESPTGYCAPDLSRTPKKGARRKSLILRAPSLELKAVWQNLLQRQIFLVNAALGSTPLSSPLDSPDVLNTLVPLSDIGFASTSISSMKIPSMDSINIRNQQIHHHQQPQQPQQNQRLSRTTEQIEMLIDEKCRILNKTGTPKSSALHLANWMKGQLDKQQERARLATERSAYDENHSQQNESDNEERITYWTRQQLEKRTKELNLEKEMGLKSKAHNAGKRLSGVEELSMSEASEAVSQISQSHSTTSDSQITVRSSPIVLDKLAVCRHCHKNCQKTANATTKKLHTPTQSPTQNSLDQTSLQKNTCHHQISTSNEYLQTNGKINHGGSDSSLSSSTITVDKPSERSSKLVASSRRETGDTESDFAQLLTDDVSQSEATGENVGPIPSTSSTGKEEQEEGGGDVEEESTNHSQRTITSKINSTRILNASITSKTEPIHEQNAFTNGPTKDPAAKIETEFNQDVTNKTMIVENNKENQKNLTKSPKSTITKSIQFIPCNCDCSPADFKNTTLSPDELEQQTCKIIASPKQSPQYTSKNDNSTLSCVSINFSNTISEGPFLPTIAVVPATPEAILTKTSTNIWDNKTPYCNISLNKLQVNNNNSPRRPLVENMTEDSCDESPLDEELPYRPMCNTLRRYGTMSSLEKLPSDERIAEDDYDLELEDQCDNADDEEDDLDENARADAMDHELNIVHNKLQRLKHASDQANNKISFFEESRAFIDKYLNRWGQESRQTNSETEEQLDECTSGATSGEEVWGTPTSGGDNDDLHLVNSENTYSSPTKSSNSINDDDDTELMMDELLMAPPMTASAIRGLLPRRRLEPLFEEETESEEEKTQQESEELQKGDIRSNGRPSENSSMTGSDAEGKNELDVEWEGVNSAEERIPPNLQMTNLGRRPLRHPDIQLPTAVLKASACETLLESKSKPVTSMMTTTNCSQKEKLQIENNSTTFTMEIMKTNHQTTMTTTSTTINNVNVSTNKNGTVSAEPIASLVKPMKFHAVPPPPPPRRLPLTQNRLNISGLGGPKKFGTTVDDGLLVDVAKQKEDIHTPKSEIIVKKRNNVKSSLTIIETSMLDSDASHRVTYKSSTTALEISKPMQGTMSQFHNHQESSRESTFNARELTGLNLSPKIEMRLALRHDLIDDENLMCYIPGTNLTTILGHDLSTYQRLTGRDLLSRSANPSEPVKEAVTLCSQQRNSKMDTPTVNRRPPLNNTCTSYEQQQQQQGQSTHPQQQTSMAILGLSGGLARVGEVPQHLQPNRNTWSSFAYVEPSREENVLNASVRKNVNVSSTLNDSELSMKQEMIYCMSPSKSGLQQAKKTLVTTKTIMNKDTVANRQLKRSTSAKSMHKSEDVNTDEIAGVSGAANVRKRKIGREEVPQTETGRRSRIINFLKRRNSEVNNTTPVQSAHGNKISTESEEHTQLLSPRKDVDKPSLNRRLWKQITRRRRASSMSEIVANS